jgi:hypothetical protein
MTISDSPIITARATILAQDRFGNTLLIIQARHNPRKSKAVTGAMGMYSERREARMGKLKTQPVSASVLMTATHAMNKAE